MSFRAHAWGEGLPHLIHGSGADKDRLDHIAPTVLRLDTFAKQPALGSLWSDYTEDPYGSRYQGGIADGGAWLVHPGVDGQDYGDDFAPTGRSLNTPTLGFVDGVRLGFGLPRIEDGGIRSGYGLTGADGDLEMRWYSSAGSASHNFSLTSDGTIRIRNLGADPPTPPAGYVDLYAKSGDLFQIDDTGTVTSLV